MRSVSAIRAVRRKLQLLAGLGNFWPTAARAGKLIATGQFRAFGRKLLNTSADIRAGDAVPDRPGPPLFLAGHILKPGGYDHVVFAILRGLIEAGVNVLRDSRAAIQTELVLPAYRPAEGRRTNQPRLAIVPPHLLARFKPDRRTAAFTMWETDTLPPDAVRQLNHCGMVIVPSQWGADCFRKNGVAVPLEVVPLGYDPALFQPGFDFPTICTFGTAGSLDEGGLRKNIQQVIDLFRRTFPDEGDVLLRVKVSPASAVVETYGDPRILLTRGQISTADLAHWYRSLTCYVNGSFGEGFGLHLLEAMGCGRPLISTRFGGAMFFDSAVGYEVSYRLREARNSIYRGYWAEPDDEQMMARMRQVYADREKAAQLGTLSAERAAGFTWSETVRKLLGVLKIGR